MGSWIAPEGMVGSTDHVRVFASHVRPSTCAQFAAARARPQLRPRRPEPRRPSGLEPFPLGRIMDALDLIEFDGVEIDRAVALVIADPAKPTVHEAVARWLGSAVRNFIDATVQPEESSGSPAWRPDRNLWVVQAQVPGTPPQSYELCAWGRRYESTDGTSRELRIPTSSRQPREPETAEVAVAAYVAGWGSRVVDVYSSEPYQPGDTPELARVRVIQVHCATSTTRVLFDGSAADARDLYTRHARDPLRRAVDGGSYTPSSDCAKCKIASICPALPRLPRLLPISDGSSGPTQSRRVWSATTGRDFRACPAREYLRQVALPRDPALEYAETAVRGQAVHAWLRAAHVREPRRACTVADLPDNPEHWSAGRWTVTGEQAKIGWEALRWHGAICPLASLSADAMVQAETQVVALDMISNALVVATPDLLYTDGPAWVWREIKTSQSRFLADGLELLRRFPQLAIAVGLLWAGALPGDRDGARIEVEQLSPHTGTVDILVPADPQVRAAAREVVAELVDDWYPDTSAPPRPGEKCRTCEVSSWCPSAMHYPPVVSADVGASP
jgi:hypothetical protein